MIILLILLALADVEYRYIADPNKPNKVWAYKPLFSDSNDIITVKNDRGERTGEIEFHGTLTSMRTKTSSKWRVAGFGDGYVLYEPIPEPPEPVIITDPNATDPNTVILWQSRLTR